MSSNENMNELYTELKMLDNHIQEIQKQIQSLDEQLVDLEYIRQSILELKEAGKDKKVLVPLSNGIFAEAEIKNSDSLLVNVGSNVVVKKSFEDTAEMMQSQSKEIAQMREKLERSMHNLINRAVEIEGKIKQSGN